MRDRTEGARLLRLAKEQQRLTDDEIEKKIGGGSVNRYMSGQRVPDLQRAIALEDAFEIPVRAWFERVVRPRGKSARMRQNGQTTRQGARP